MRVTFSNRLKETAKGLLGEQAKKDIAEIEATVAKLYESHNGGSVPKELFDRADALDSRVKIAYQEIEDLYRALHGRMASEEGPEVRSNKKEVDYVVDGFWVDVYGIYANALKQAGVIADAAELIDVVEAS